METQMIIFDTTGEHIVEPKRSVRFVDARFNKRNSRQVQQVLRQVAEQDGEVLSIKVPAQEKEVAYSLLELTGPISVIQDAVDEIKPLLNQGNPGGH